MRINKQTKMNFRKLSISVFAVFFGTLITMSSLAINIISAPINNVRVSFILSEDVNILKGKIWKKGDLSQADKVKVSLFSSQNVLIIRDEFSADGALKRDNYWETDFSLNLTGKNLTGVFTLKVEVINKNGRAFAFGEGERIFKGTDLDEAEIPRISDLAIRVDKDMVRGGVKFLNKELDDEFKVKIDVYKDDQNRSYVGTFLSDIFEVKMGETKEMFFTFSKPNDPQLYEAEVAIIQQEKEVTGKLIKPFLVDGNFGEFYEIIIKPEKYIEKGETITVEFRGATTTDRSEVLSVEIELTNNDDFSAKKFINVKPENALKEFGGKEVFLADKGVGQLFATVTLWNKNNKLASLGMSTESFKKPKNINFISKIKDIKTGAKLSNSDKYKIILILVLIVLAIAVFIRGLIRSNKSKNFFIFFCIIMFGGSAFASYPTGHFFPQNEMAYSSSTDSGYFNEIGFWGYVSSVKGGWLPTTVETINYDITLTPKGGGTETVVLGTFASNGNSYEYKFSIDVPTSLADGTYNPVIRLYGAAVAARLLELEIKEENNTQAVDINIILTNTDGDKLDIIIDGTAPDPEFVFTGKNNNGFANATFTLTPACGDYGSGCYAVAVPGADFTGFDVTGNFCDSSIESRTFCGDVHKFQICDIAGNCTIKSADIDFYDPVKPTMDGIGFEIPGNLFYSTSLIASGYIEKFKIKNLQDPATENDLPEVDDSVCRNSSDFTAPTGSNVCIEKIIICAPSPYDRGETKDGVCGTICPLGFILNNDNLCEPECYYDRFPYCFDLIMNE